MKRKKFVTRCFQDNSTGEASRHFGHYWKQLGVVVVSCLFMFVYEFCER